MTTDEKTKKLEPLFEGQDVFNLLKVDTVNHRPHMYMIGPRHVTHASNHHSGMLGEATLRAIPCAHPGCRLTYEEHTYDTVGFLQLQRNCTNEEANDVLGKVLAEMPPRLIDGFVFVETDEKFRIE